MFNEEELNKGDAKKFHRLLQMCNGNLVNAKTMMQAYLNSKPVKLEKPEDKVAITIEEALPQGLNLGKGYVVKRSRGKGASGYTATKVE